MIRIHRLQHWFSLPDPSIGGSLQDSVSMRQLAGIDLGSERVPDETTIICAPSPTKNKVKARDPQMQQTKKGNQWHFSMKAHIGTASQSKLMHPMAFTAAHAHDSQALPHLLHGAETRARGDSAYAGPADIIKAHAPPTRSTLPITRPRETIRPGSPRRRRTPRSRGCAPKSSMHSDHQAHLPFRQGALPGPD